MKPLPPPLQGRRIQRLHCAGVGGMGLGPLAIFLSRLGFTVSGEDDALPEAMRIHLLQAGVRIGGMDTDCELLVVSSALAPKHPALRLAATRCIPSMRRGEVLAAACKGRRLVAVCGAHGKTTTTALLVHALQQAGCQPGYVLGGLFADERIPPASAGLQDWVVAEVDESDGTIQAFTPEITVVTNLDWDHPDFYKTQAQLHDTFRDLFSRTANTVLYPHDCGVSAALIRSAPRSCSFGGAGADYACTGTTASEAGQVLDLCSYFVKAQVAVRALGAFNASNAVAALAAVKEMGYALGADILSRYPGVCRRQSRVEAQESFTIIEDYAHHPEEIRALLLSLRNTLVCGQRLVVVFQPHRYSRTLQFRDDFARALELADCVHLLEVYSAGEAPLEGGRVAALSAAFSEGFPVQNHGEDEEACFAALASTLGKGDLLTVVGAGDIDQMLRRWLDGRRWDRWFAALTQEPFSPGMKLSREEPLGNRTTLRAGGSARVYAEPSGPEELALLLRAAQKAKVAVYFLGRGSNLLIPDSGVQGLVIALNHPHWSRFEIRADGRVWAGAGLRLKNLCGLAAKEGLHGFEFLEGIPGCVGGSLRMNAGAMGGWIFDLVEEVQLMTMDGAVHTRSKAEMDVAYRQCRGLDSAVALGAIFRPVGKQAGEAIMRQVEEYRAKRQSSQPREPSAGCIFKNPEGNSAGRLIDECGLKGEREGGAMVSPIHANFIVNIGEASSTDVIKLVRRVRAVVRAQRGIELEPEVLLFGGEWNKIL